MKKIIVFGDLPIATKIVKFIRENLKMDLIGVVIGNNMPNNNDPWEDDILIEYAKKEKIRLLTQKEILEKYKDKSLYLGLSCRFSKIIKKEIISKFEFGVLNLHGGLLPEFAGLYSVNHTILCDSKIAGGTIHFVDEGIDTGDIIKRCEFKVEEEDTAYTLFQKTQKVLYENLKEILIKIDNEEEIMRKKISELVKEGYLNRYFNKNSLVGMKEIKIEELNSREGLLRIRAFDFPGYEPAYIKINDKKIYLRTKI